MTSSATPRLASSRLPLLLLLSAVVILADRLSKDWISAHIISGQAITLIPNVFRLTDVHNTGAAFSLFESLSPLLVRNSLIAFSGFAVLVMFIMLWRLRHAVTLSSIALALILGGALGNLYDRIRFHYVVDFLEVKIVHYHWPDFNVADSCICIGAGLLMLELLRPQHPPVAQPRSGLEETA